MNLDEKITRYKAFYNSRHGGLMTIIEFNTQEELPCIMPLNQVDWEDEKSIRAYAQSILYHFRKIWQVKASIDDDGIPTIQVLAGTGMVAATYVNGAILHQERDTNYLKPPIINWDEGIENIGFDPENRFYHAQMMILRFLIEEWDRSYSIVPFTHFDPLDLANQFRGNDIFYDFYTNPDKLHLLLQRCTKSILALERHMRQNYMDGYEFEGLGIYCWCPGGNYLSCDMGDMISSELLSDFGLPYFDRIVTEWGGGFLHHHELGAYQVTTWATIKNLSIQFLNRDMNTRHLPELIDEKIIASTFDTPIFFICNYEEFIRGRERWAKGKFIISVICRDITQANDVIKKTQLLRNF